MEHFLYICIRKPTKQHTAMAKKTETAVASTKNQPKKLSKIGIFMESVKGKKIGEIYDMRAVLR